MIKGVSGTKALLSEAENLYGGAAGRNIQGLEALADFIDSVRGLLGCSIDDFIPRIGRVRDSFAEARDGLISTEGGLNEANQKVVEALGAASVTGSSSLSLITVGRTLIEPFADKGVAARLDSVAAKTEALANTTVRRIHGDVGAVIEEAQEILTVIPPAHDQYDRATGLCQQIQSTL